MFCLFRAQSLLQHWRSHFHALYRRVVFERARLLFSQPYIRIGPCKRSAVFTGDVPEVSIAHRPRPLDGWRRRWWGHWTHKKNFGYDAPSSIAAGVGNSKKKDALRFFLTTDRVTNIDCLIILFIPVIAITLKLYLNHKMRRISPHFMGNVLKF